MKFWMILPVAALILITGCGPKTNGSNSNKLAGTQGDTIRIANDALEYEIIIIDPGFNSWFIAYAKPRNFYSQSFLEARNTIWVTEWNNRVLNSGTRSRNLYEMRIDYQPGIDYGYEVNYMLFNYLSYFQLTNRIRLGGFDPRI